MPDPAEDNLATWITLQSAKPFGITGARQYANTETPANQARGAIKVR